MSFIYSIFTSLFVALLLISIEKAGENKFVKECLETKVKKQNMERFIFILIDRFLHPRVNKGILTYKVYSKILNRNQEYNSEKEKENHDKGVDKT